MFFFFSFSLLKNLTEPSVIILDRASYHTTFDENEFFSFKSKKVWTEGMA